MTWVHDRIFAAGGSHIPATWEQFSGQTRVTAVIHLNPGAPQRFVGPTPEAFLWLAVGRESEADMQSRWLAAHFVQQQLVQRRNVLLHSGEGRHRTRWVFVAYLLLEGKSWRAALRQAEETPWLAPYLTDQARWRTFVDWLESDVPSAAVSSA